MTDMVEKINVNNDFDLIDCKQKLKQAQLFQVSVKAGGCGIHDGRLWHDSGQNKSKKPRRGLGIYFVPDKATFRD